MMKKQHIFFLAVFAVLLTAAVAQAQTPAKIYTKMKRMADFPTTVTKVVLSSQSMFELAVREEVISHWSASPYEFCTVDEYEQLKTDNSCYFLRLVQDEGVAFLCLSKGGKEDEPDNLKIPFEVVRLPIGAYGDITGREASLLGAFVDIIQQFALESMQSDRVAYTGMGTYNGKDVKGKKIYVNPERACEVLEAGDPDALAAIVIAPREISFKTWCYKMLIDAGTHEMYYYDRIRYKDKSDAAFSDKELTRFEKRHATVIR